MRRDIKAFVSDMERNRIACGLAQDEGWGLHGSDVARRRQAASLRTAARTTEGDEREGADYETSKQSRRQGPAGRPRRRLGTKSK